MAADGRSGVAYSRKLHILASEDRIRLVLRLCAPTTASRPFFDDVSLCSFRLGRRAGLSYMASVLVVTLLTVVLAAPVAYWGFNESGWGKDIWDSALGERRDVVAEKFLVERVVFKVAPHSHTNVTVYVRNYGSIPVTISKILVDHSETVNAVTSTGSANLTLNHSQIGWVQVTLSYALDEEVAHSVIVISSRGCVSSGYWKVV